MEMVQVTRGIIIRSGRTKSNSWSFIPFPPTLSHLLMIPTVCFHSKIKIKDLKQPLSVLHSIQCVERPSGTHVQQCYSGPRRSGKLGVANHNLKSMLFSMILELTSATNTVRGNRCLTKVGWVRHFLFCQRLLEHIGGNQTEVVNSFNAGIVWVYSNHIKSMCLSKTCSYYGFLISMFWLDAS